MWTPSSLNGGIDHQLEMAQAHYDTYEALAQALGIDHLKRQAAGVIGTQKIDRAVRECWHLNSISLRSWDAAAYYWQGKKNPLKPGFTFSLSEGVCLLKHVAKHHIANEPRPEISDAERLWYADQDIYDPQPFWLSVLCAHVREFADQNKNDHPEWAKVADWQTWQIMEHLRPYQSKAGAVAWIWENIAPRSEARFDYLRKMDDGDLW